MSMTLEELENIVLELQTKVETLEYLVDKLQDTVC